MKTLFKRVFAPFLATVFATLACSIFSVGGDPSDPNILFQDDFSSKDGGWAEIRDEDGILDYDQNGYRIQVLDPNFEYWSFPGLSFSDVSIEVDARKLAGPEDNVFGIICRYQDEFNFYAFLASSDGFYAVGKVKGDSQSILGADVMEFTDAIMPGDATNKLRGDCVGSTLTFYINGTQVASVSDSDFSTGDVGLLAGTFAEPGTDMLFDNFVVRNP